MSNKHQARKRRLHDTSHMNSVIRTGPEPAKPAGLTGLQGWPVRSANFFEKTGFFSKSGMEPAWTGRSGLGIQETQIFLKKPENKTLLMYFGASDVLWSVYCGSNSQESWSLILFSSSKLKFVKVILSLGFELRNATETTTIIG